MGQGCCMWDQRESEGSAVSREHLSSAGHGGLVQVASSNCSSPPEPLHEGCLLVPPVFWPYSTEHIVCLCACLCSASPLA